ncbi:acyl-CoA dehydrogenase [Saccharopolyspora sp. SCSIO 74807]|uniref:acyl-CoA dehydrogenase n=1 Tax=Saccharopolyspora sp. SCSIO 74807 TaxID=3118084 RepID=UPI0030CD97D8
MVAVEEAATGRTAVSAFEAVANEAVSQCLRQGSRRPDDHRRRWRYLCSIGADDLDLARLVEAHVDAATINFELGGPPVQPGQYWGVWAAESPSSRVEGLVDNRGAWQLSGTKQWCSGATVCTHALITAHCRDGPRLFAVDCGDGVVPGEPSWQGVGMAGSDTRHVTLHAVPAVPVGGPSAYLDRPGFWYGAVSVAACWLGGAVGIAGPLYRAGARGRLDEHGRAHLGAVDASLAGSRWALSSAAEELWDDANTGHVTALRVRAIVEDTTRVVIDRVGRALGPGPLATDGEHSRRIADLTTYVRQSHAERDLAALAELLDESDGDR